MKTELSEILDLLTAGGINKNTALTLIGNVLEIDRAELSKELAVLKDRHTDAEREYQRVKTWRDSRKPMGYSGIGGCTTRVAPVKVY